MSIDLLSSVHAGKEDVQSIGFDLSKFMVKEARKKVNRPNVRFHHENIMDVEFSPPPVLPVKAANHFLPARLPNGTCSLSVWVCSPALWGRVARNHGAIYRLGASSRRRGVNSDGPTTTRRQFRALS